MPNTIITTNKTPFGANYNEKTKSVDFRLFSKNATRVLLCIFEKEKGEDAVMTLDMEKTGENTFETSVKIYALGNLKRPFYYGYRVFGANFEYSNEFELGSDIGFKALADSNNNRFNPNKIAIDPYGLEVSHTIDGGERVNKSNFKEDNAKTAPKSVFYNFENIEIPMIKRALKDEIIGEVHIKDLVELMNVDGSIFEKATIFAKTLASFGFTMIEFLPLTEFDNYKNYWGYMPLSYFALTKKYAKNHPLEEFRKLIKAFHEVGLKVCLDMVYNHTGGVKIYNNDPNDVQVSCYSLIDNKTYYKQTRENYYTTYSACDNDFNVANKFVQNLITDSIEFWARQGVDAFRFDLAASLMDIDESEKLNYDKCLGYISKIKDELEKRGVHVLNSNEEDYGVHLIAEPWSCVMGCSYQLGNFPKYFGEWCDVFRNTIRANTISTNTTDPLGLRNAIEGCPFNFGEDLKAINYVSCHDGFTLNDLNSYDKKSATTNGGNEWELSSSFEGDSEIQEKSIRKQVALLLISRGIPMMNVGDIVAHTKLGNNNSYDIDSSINYIDFSKIKNTNSRAYRIFEFTTSMIDFRRAHKIFRDVDYNKKIEYYGPNANVIPQDNLNYWQNKGADFLSFKTMGDDVIYCAISKANYAMEIVLPKNSVGKSWYFAFDTSKNQKVSVDGVEFKGDKFILEPMSVSLFFEK